MDEYIKFDDAIKAMYRLEKEDIETYGCEIPEGFDGERARLALCLLPRYKDGEVRQGNLISRQDAIKAACEGADEWDGGCSPSRNEYIENAINKIQ